MTDQYYRLARSWTEGEWPLGLKPELMSDYNRVLPSRYAFAIRESVDGETRVELHEYVGEYDEIEEAETDESSTQA